MAYIQLFVEFIFSKLMSNCIIGKNNFVALTAEGFNFGEFKSSGLHEKHAVATWNLGTISVFT
jgi:hypothetical protein